MGAVFQRGEPLLLEERGANDMDARLSPRNQSLFARAQDALPPNAATICLPLRVAGETIGVLELLNLGVEPRIRPDDVPLLQTFGNLAAAAIKNAQLYAQTELNRRRLEAFDAVGTAISTAADLDDLLRSVLDVVMGLVLIPAGALLLHDPGQSRLALGAGHGLPGPAAEWLHDVAVIDAPCEEVVRYGQPALRPLLEERGEAPLLEAGLSHGAYLPLLAGGTVVGVLALYGDGTLAEHVDATTLMPLGSQVGFAVANIKLYENSQLERRKLTTVINSIAEGVVLCDSNGLLTLANQAAMSMLSLAEVPYDQPLADMPDFYGIRDLDGEPLPVESLPLARALGGELFHDHRVLLRGVGGRDSVMSFSGAPARADNGLIEGAVVIFRDITASQRLERAKDEFLAVAAHELRSPLAAVRGYADLLLRREQQRGDEDSRDLRGLTVLSQQVTHMLRMVDDLLDVSRLDAGQLELQLSRVNLVALAGEVLDQQRPSAPGHELLLTPGPAELWVHADSLRIRQVLTNLVGNAVRYGTPNTSVVVRVATQPADDGPPTRSWPSPTRAAASRGAAWPDLPALLPRQPPPRRGPRPGIVPEPRVRAAARGRDLGRKPGGPGQHVLLLAAAWQRRVTSRRLNAMRFKQHILDLPAYSRARSRASSPPVLPSCRRTRTRWAPRQKRSRPCATRSRTCTATPTWAPRPSRWPSPSTLAFSPRWCCAPTAPTRWCYCCAWLSSKRATRP